MICQICCSDNSPFQAFIVVFGTPSGYTPEPIAVRVPRRILRVLEVACTLLNRLAILAVATGAGDTCIELAAINLGRSFWKTGYLMIRFAASTMDRTPIP